MNFGRCFLRLINRARASLIFHGNKTVQNLDARVFKLYQPHIHKLAPISLWGGGNQSTDLHLAQSMNFLCLVNINPFINPLRLRAFLKRPFSSTIWSLIPTIYKNNRFLEQKRTSTINLTYAHTHYLTGSEVNQYYVTGSDVRCATLRPTYSYDMTRPYAYQERIIQQAFVV